MADDFLSILQTLKGGGNPTPTNSTGTGIATSERGGSAGTRETNFGLQSVNEGAGVGNAETPEQK